MTFLSTAPRDRANSALETATRRLAFQERNAATGWDLWTAPMERDDGGLRLGEPEIFLQNTLDEQNPSFPPDGRWLAYSSTESGLYQVYVRAFPDTGGKWQVSSDAGRQPEWSRSSPELLFRSADNQIMAVTYRVKGDSFRNNGDACGRRGL